MKHIVLMADIVGSREQHSKELMNHFKKLVEETNDTFTDAISSPLTITLGDEFQAVVKSAAVATQIILFFEESLIHKQLHFKLRYVINEGNIDTLINTVRAYEMLGEGLTEARELLGKLKEGDSRFFVSLADKNVSTILNESFTIYQSIIEEWKVEKDYEIVSSFLTFKDYKKISAILKRNRSLIWKRERSLHLKSYYAVKKIIELSVKPTS